MSKAYETIGKPILMRILEVHTEFKLIPDKDEYVIECKFHGLVSTGLNVLEISEDLKNHKEECQYSRRT